MSRLICSHLWRSCCLLAHHATGTCIPSVCAAMLLLPYAHECMLLLLRGRLGRPDRRAARKDALMQLVQNAATAAAALGGRRRQRGVPSAPLGGRRRQRRVPSAVPSAPRRTHRLEDRRLDLLRRRPVCTGSPMGPLKGSLMGRGERHERAATP